MGCNSCQSRIGHRTNCAIFNGVCHVVDVKLRWLDARIRGPEDRVGAGTRLRAAEDHLPEGVASVAIRRW